MTRSADSDAALGGESNAQRTRQADALRPMEGGAAVGRSALRLAVVVAVAVVAPSATGSRATSPPCAAAVLVRLHLLNTQRTALDDHAVYAVNRLLRLLDSLEADEPVAARQPGVTVPRDLREHHVAIWPRNLLRGAGARGAPRSAHTPPCRPRPASPLARPRVRAHAIPRRCTHLECRTGRGWRPSARACRCCPRRRRRQRRRRRHRSRPPRRYSRRGPQSSCAHRTGRATRAGARQPAPRATGWRHGTRQRRGSGQWA